VPAPARTGPQEIVDVLAAEPASGNGLPYPAEEDVAGQFRTDPELFGEPYVNGSGPADLSDSALPRRSPGASGITGVPKPKAEEPRQAPTDTSAFFSGRAQAAANGSTPEGAPESEPADEQPAPPARHAASEHDDSPIFQRMLSEWLVDWDTLTAPPQDWKSVWDHGWAAAAEAEEKPVQSRTDHGLPVRDPGARLVPGSADPTGYRNGAHAKPDDSDGPGTGQVPSGDGFGYGRHELGQGSVPARDPDAVRASISNHFGGVHAGRSHARDADEGTDTE
jgi:hypothetical protein